MTTLNLLVDDDYLETFIDSLDKDKIKVIEAEFEENKRLLQESLDSYSSNSNDFIPYFESMKNMSIWLKERES